MVFCVDEDFEYIRNSLLQKKKGSGCEQTGTAYTRRSCYMGKIFTSVSCVLAAGLGKRPAVLLF